MFKFYLKRSMKDVIGHLILIGFPALLIIILNTVYKNQIIENGSFELYQQFLTFITIGFVLMFHIYGSAISFETMAADLFTPMRERLDSTPVELKSIIITILSTSTVVSFLQSVVVIFVSVLVLSAEIPLLYFLLPLIMISVIFNQLLGTVILLWSKKVKTATVVTTVYGMVVPFLVGLYFPLPKTSFFDFISNYGTPFGLMLTAINGLVNQEYSKFIIGITPIIIFTVFFMIILKPLTRRLAK